MRFSVIVPAYNAERYLPACLDSIEAQTFRDFELVLVDDGSYDGTPVICDAWAKRHGYARVVHGANQGPLLARRAGVSVAQGNYLVFVDADDCLREDALAKVGSVIDERHPDIVGYRWSRNEGYARQVGRNELSAGEYFGDAYQEVRRCLCRGGLCNLWGKAISRACFDMNEDYSAYTGFVYGEDFFQMIAVVARALSFVQVDDALYYYRPNKASTTSHYDPKYQEDSVFIMDRLLGVADDWGLEREAGLERLGGYVGRLQIMWRDPEFKGRRREECERARRLIDESPATVREAIPDLRIDRRLIARAVVDDHWRLSGLISYVIDLLRRVFKRG